MLDEPHLAGCDGAQASVHHRQVEALEIGNVSGHIERHDLAFALLRHLVHAGEALHEEAGPRRAVALPHDVLIGPDVHDLHGQGFQCRFLVIGEADDVFEPADQHASMVLCG